ncbi:MAG: ornithine carbamoyltransferase [archaeon]
MKHLICLKDISKEEILQLVNKAVNIKRNPSDYSTILKDKTLLMIFEKPSLRTRVSFETGMTRMGGHAIYYNTSTSPMGKKESIADTVKAASRYVDIIMARLFSHRSMEEMAQHSDVPVINGLTDFSHPCQILSDLQTILEKKGKLVGLKIAYLGNSNNNVTHSIMYGCLKVGMNVSIGCPSGTEYEPLPSVVEECKRICLESGSTLTITHNAMEAVRDADVIYTDSWMSYHIPENQKEERLRIFQPFQVNAYLMSHAKSNAIFMNCLPAMRGYEQTAEVIDGPQSVVFDQAENRLHMQNAILLKLLGFF